MSKPDMDNIITSPEAEAFLRMVTKGFYHNSFMGLWIYEVIGREWDEMRAWAEGMKEEIHPQTCTWSIPIWEWVYGFEPDDTLQLEYRRQRILAKIVAVKLINPEIIRRGVAALIGAEPENVEVDPKAGPYRFDVIIHPTGAPFPYNRIAPYIREIKPSHLRFEAAVETKVEITIEIDTQWNLLGFGLTGQYNAGMRPNTNIRAQLRELLITIDREAIGAVFEPQAAGTAYATAAGTQTQRMNPPSTVFSQDSVGIGIGAEGKGYGTKAPLTGTESSVAGQYPYTQIQGADTDINVGNIIEAKGAGFTPPAAGTKPYQQRLFAESETAEVAAEIKAEGYAFQPEAAGTKPQASTRLTLQGVEVKPEIGAGAYHANYPATRASSSGAGRYPAPQETLAKGSGGIMPTIETESYTVAFRLCGTTVTKK